MKVAIVGTSVKLTAEEHDSVCVQIHRLLSECLKDTIVISGGAKGVDNIAVAIAKELGLKTEVFLPKKQNWKYFKQRNNIIAKECDKLYCFTIPNRTKESKCYHHAKHEKHEKTAGCWTLAKALALSKVCELIVVS